MIRANVTKSPGNRQMRQEITGFSQAAGGIPIQRDAFPQPNPGAGPWPRWGASRWGQGWRK